MSLPTVKMRGRLYKKRGGLGRHSKNPYQPRTFVLSEAGVLSYYETDEPVEAMTPRQSLDLLKTLASLSAVDEEDDAAPTPHIIVLEHNQGQRWKLCAETVHDLRQWVDQLEPYCSRKDPRQVERDSTDSSPTSKQDGRDQYGQMMGAGGGLTLGPKVREILRKGKQRSSLGRRDSKAVLAASTSPSLKNMGPLKTASSSAISPTGFSLILALAVGAVTSGHVFTIAEILESAAPWFVVAGVLGLFHLYVGVTLVRHHDEARIKSETLVSLILAPPRLPRLASLRSPSLVGLNKLDKAASVSALDDAQVAEKVKPGTSGLRRVAFSPEGGPPGTWSESPASDFKIRQLDYLKTKQKAPSDPDALYNVVAVDLFDTEHRITNFSQYYDVPLEGVAPSPDPKVPALMLVNASVPSETGPLRAQLDADGHGYQCVISLKLAPKARQELELLVKDPDTEEVPRHRKAALKLLQMYCEVAPTEDQLTAKERGRFKVLAQIRNIDDVNIPSYAKSYNGKPALINKTGVLTRSEDGRLFEMDINVHAFGYLARSGLQSIFRDFQDFVLSVGFVIEGRRNEELPEVMLATFDFNHVTWSMAQPLN